MTSIGQQPTANESRDAIHVAITPVVAAEKLKPGQRVGLNSNGKAVSSGDIVGIVDPFLEGAIAKGVRFWLCLLPNTVTGMRHHWRHPAFPSDSDPTEVQDAEVWLRNYAVEMNTYDDDPEAAFTRLIHGIRNKDIYAYGSDLGGLYDLDDADELKEYAETYLGIKIDFSEFTFRCGC